ncbi:hypothetical protein COUCH_16630 [Couchioplanes caeruleus]|uniref:hypothetical protein n=1 Tax=Couchioplanes caeruleus TaxID=56438 RepID=UPI0020BF935A|nr:hypothetical protein [Couchioplanes caeruleus]UQU67796.1 hypothetical protein COUCH_16630 [Couchioplanes caeruleus]
MADLVAGSRTEVPHRRTWPIVVAAAVLAAAAAAGLLLLTWPRTTTVRTMPATVAYGGGSPVHVAVLRHVHAPLGTDHWLVVLGSDPGGDYGHVVRLDATGVDPASVAVQWEQDAAVLVYGSGHRLSVPSRFFTGGR